MAVQGVRGVLAERTPSDHGGSDDLTLFTEVEDHAADEATAAAALR
jgi:hypothetical protein